MNATDVTGPCAAAQYRLIMLTCGSRKLEFRHDEKPIGWNAELWTVRFGYPKTETKPSDGFQQISSKYAVVFRFNMNVGIL